MQLANSGRGEGEYTLTLGGETRFRHFRNGEESEKGKKFGGKMEKEKAEDYG